MNKTVIKLTGNKSMGAFFKTLLRHYSSDCHVSHDRQSKGSLLTDEGLIQKARQRFSSTTKGILIV